MPEEQPILRPAVTEDSSAPAGRKEAVDLLRRLGQVLNSLSIFGAQHKATQQALDDGFAALSQMTARQPSVTLGADHKNLLCDAQVVEPNTALLRTLLRRWNALGLSSLELTQGISRDEFQRLMMILGTAPDAVASAKALAQPPAQDGFTHLHLKRLSYQAVSDDDVVVRKQALANEALPAPAKKPSKVAAIGSEIIAYLQSYAGGALTVSPEAAALASQPSRLAELLLRSADIRPETAQVAGGEQLGNLVVGCLRRLHGHLAATPAAKTKQGKKAVQQTLIMLEKEVIEKLRNVAGAEAAAAAAPAIEEAVGEMLGDLRREGLVDDYVKKRQQSAISEKRLVRFLKAQQGHPERTDALGKVQQQLTASGVTDSAWGALLQKSASAGGKAGGAAGDAPPLTLLLLRLTELLNPATPPPSAAPLQTQVEALVSQIGTGMDVAMAGVEQKLGTLRGKIKAMLPLPAASDAQVAQKQAFTRREIIATLAEVVQELRQPLAVISGAVETLSGGHLGKVPDLQRGMLQLALQSSRRVAVIVDALADIAGLPTALQPDARILQRIYND
jgi:hypothetical protein